MRIQPIDMQKHEIPRAEVISNVIMDFLLKFDDEFNLSTDELCKILYNIIKLSEEHTFSIVLGINNLLVKNNEPALHLYSDRESPLLFKFDDIKSHPPRMMPSIEGAPTPINKPLKLAHTINIPQLKI